MLSQSLLVSCDDIKDVEKVKKKTFFKNIF